MDLCLPYAGQDLENAKRTSLEYIISGTQDPSLPGNRVQAKPGTIYLLLPPVPNPGGIVPKLFQKMDDGCTTNWVLAGSPSGSGAVQPTQVLYVDGSRTDLYTEDGGLLTPFKTIQAAVDQVQLNGDNTDLKPYSIDIATGFYNENVVIAGAGFVNLALEGHGSAFMGDLTMSVEDAFKTFYCHGLGMGILTQIGAVDGGSAFQFANQFVLCAFTDITIKNLATMYCLQSYMTGTLDQENCFITAFQQQVLGAVVNVTWIPANPKPAIAFTSFMALESCVCNSALINVGAGAMLQNRLGSRVGAPGGVINVDGDFNSYTSFIRSGINVSATGTFTNNGSFYDPAGLVVAPGGTFNNNNASELDRYDATPGDWVAPAPVNVQQAITRLAAVVAVLNAGPIA